MNLSETTTIYKLACLNKSKWELYNVKMVKKGRKKYYSFKKETEI